MNEQDYLVRDTMWEWVIDQICADEELTDRVIQLVQEMRPEAYEKQLILVKRKIKYQYFKGGNRYD